MGPNVEISAYDSYFGHQNMIDTINIVRTIDENKIVEGSKNYSEKKNSGEDRIIDLYV